MERILKLILKLILATALAAPQAHAAPTSRALIEAPLARGPGVSQAELETFAEAHSRSTLAQQLDLDRPGAEASERLQSALERAQSAWLGGSIEAARSQFQSLTRLTLEADWRGPQREVIHYAHLRLAQSAKTAAERTQWLEKAIASFPDLQADPTLFPPPLIETFRTLRSQILADARVISLEGRFADFRFILINGRKFELEPNLKLRVPGGVHRVTLLSDATAPVSARLSLNEIETYSVMPPALATGDCQNPAGAEPFSPLATISVLFGSDCVRSRDQKGWYPMEIEGQASISSTAPHAVSLNLSRLERDSEPTVSSTKPWLWAGLAALLASAVVIAFHEPKASEPAAGPPQVKPVHRKGF